MAWRRRKMRANMKSSGHARNLEAWRYFGEFPFRHGDQLPSDFSFERWFHLSRHTGVVADFHYPQRVVGPDACGNCEGTGMLLRVAAGRRLEEITCVLCQGAGSRNTIASSETSAAGSTPTAAGAGANPAGSPAAPARMTSRHTPAPTARGSERYSPRSRTPTGSGTAKASRTATSERRSPGWTARHVKVADGSTAGLDAPGR
jgi:hypothetical protein